MAQTIKLKRSATSGATPTTSQLELGEVAINTYDGKMYIKKNVGGTESIVEITGGSSTLGGLSDVTISSVAADQLLQYNGSEWVNVSIAEASAIMKEYQFTATAGQSTFSGSDDNSETLSYTAGAIQVFLNGIFLDSAVDYTATNGTSVVLSETVDANDYLQVVAFKKKIGDGNVSVDTFTGNNSTTAFTLSVDPGDENNTRVFIDGVYQSKDNYSVSGTTLTFSTPPPTDTAIEIEIGNRVVTLDTLSDLDLPDNVKLRFGTSQDLEIFHDGTRSIINDAGTGDLQFQVGGSAIFDVTTDGIVMEGFPESAYELKGDIDGGIRFTVQAGEALSKGDVVYISGAAGDNTVVSKAQANSASTMPAFGFVLADIANGGSGQVVTFGNLYGSGGAALDTSTYSIGDSLYVSATTAGAFTKTPPTGESNLVQNIGKVLRVATSNGVIKVGGAGRTNATPNLDDGDIFIGNASNQSVSASLNTKIESYLDGGTSTASFASLTFDNYTLDSNKIATNQASGYNGDIFLDAAGDIILDADGGDVRLKDNGTEYLNFYAGTIERTGSLIFDVSGNITLNANGSTISLNDDTINFGQFYNNASGQFNIYAPTQDKDIVFLGNDGGSTVTALTLDMSDGGTAILASHLDMGDNQKIRLGDSDDLQLFHDGSNSYIQNGTTGNINITNTAGGEFVLVGVANGGTFLYHDGTSKFQTTSTGVDVTGTADADNVSITSTAPTLVFNRTDRTADNKRIRLAHDGQDFRIQLFNDAENAVTNAIGVNRTGMTLDSIAFYEDTGTTAKLFWDASAERLGLGTTSPSGLAHLSQAGGADTMLVFENTLGTNPFQVGQGNDDSLRFYYNAGEVMRILANGNVGIGTTSPAFITGSGLEVQRDGVATLRLEDTGSSGKALELSIDDATGAIINSGSSGLPMIFKVINSEAMRINTSGNVGIGTTSPQEKLQINGNLRMFSTGYPLIDIGITTSNYFRFLHDNPNDIFKIGKNGAATLNIAGSGNVGIGTSSPVTALQIDGTSEVALSISTSGTREGAFYSDGALTVVNAYQGNPLVFSVASSGASFTERMRIDSSGLVAIGTSSPVSSAQLTVGGTSRIAPVSGNGLLFASGGSDRMFISTSGNVGIGTNNPAQNFVVAEGTNQHGIELRPGTLSYIQAYDRAISDYGDLKIDAQTVRFGTDNGTERMRLTSSGSLGIGTQSPAYSLHVYNATNDAPMMIDSGSANGAQLRFGSSGTPKHFIGCGGGMGLGDHEDLGIRGLDNIIFSTGGTANERMRLAQNGDWVVSNTNPRVVSQFTNQAGIGWYDADLHAEIGTTNNRSALEVGRNNANSGDVITIRQQSTSVGMIGTEGGDSLVIQSNGSTGSGLRFHPSTANIDPVRQGARIDATISLGVSTHRFKDLHLSGTSYTNQVELAEISTSNSDVPNDIFIYDTRKDSDGGAWRYRTQHTTWYNETLNTSTRGARKEFPAVAVIIVESDQLTIYDGDDPDMPMWMVFNAGSDMSNETLLRGTAIRGAAMLNGILCVATADTLVYIRFIDEYHNLFHTSSEYFFPARTGIVDRNVVIAEPQQRVGGENGTYYGLASSSTISVSMTVLPNAPIHPTCGLPIPTIGVACGTAGNSIIRHDGKVVDITSGDSAMQANHAPVFLKDGRVAIQNYDDDRGWRIMNIPEENTTIQNHYNRGGDFVLEWYNSWNHAPSSTQLGDITIRGKGVNPASVYIPLVEANEHIAIGHNDDGVSLVARQPDDPVNGMSAFIEKDYNTGWMPGATKLAMAPAITTTFSSTEMITNGTFSNGTTGWSGGNATVSESGGVLTVTGTHTTGGNQTAVATVTGTVTPGEHYILTFEIVEHVANKSSSGVIVGGGEVVENNHLHYWYPNTVGTHTTTIVANNTYLSVQLHAGTAVGVITKFDNVSLFRAEPDRSARHRATQISGSVTRVAVATSAELRAYENFSSSNYMFQNYYNDELNFGTGDFAIACWVKAGGTNAYRRFISLQNPSGAQTDNDAINIKFSPHGTNNQYIYAYFGSTEGTLNTPDAAINVWHHVVLTRRGNHYNMYLNGKLTDTKRSSQSKGSTNQKLYIGKGAEGNEVFTGGSITLIKIAKGTAPSSEQVARMYRDELCMFDENSNITLYGSDSGVRGLAHDDDTNLLHVGTPAGRSVFRGLRRVENTTTAVGATTNAAISASNGLVVENT